jgi:hypothetical protein
MNSYKFYHATVDISNENNNWLRIESINFNQALRKSKAKLEGKTCVLQATDLSGFH